MTVNTELDLENKEALKKAAFLAATVNTAPVAGDVERDVVKVCNLSKFSCLFNLE
jgi:hypothetical protein